MNTERIIKFPYPEYNSCFNNDAFLQKDPYCLCYQYNVTSKQYGPYGFNTEKAQLILQKLFPELYFWNEEKSDLIKTTPSISKKGIYFYNDGQYIESIRKELHLFSIQKRKNDFLEKKGKIANEIKNIPFPLRMYKDTLFDSDVINQLISTDVKFFIVQFFTPEAGDSIVLFDNPIMEKIKEIAIMEAVDLADIDSIDILKPW